MSSARTSARDRAAILSGAALLAFSAWWTGLLFQAPMPMVGTGVAEGVTFLAAWGVMMAAMMLPSAVPMISLYGVLHRNPSSSTPAGIPTAVFAFIYLLMWLAFGVPVHEEVDVGHKWDLRMAAVRTGRRPRRQWRDQLTPLKRACLQACRSPLGFLSGAHRSGIRGTLRLALEHAAYCIGCCCVDVVLVAAVPMSPQWRLLIAAVVAIEKLLPAGGDGARRRRRLILLA